MTLIQENPIVHNDNCSKTAQVMLSSFLIDWCEPASGWWRRHPSTGIPLRRLFPTQCDARGGPRRCSTVAHGRPEWGAWLFVLVRSTVVSLWSRQGWGQYLQRWGWELREVVGCNYEVGVCKPPPLCSFPEEYLVIVIKRIVIARIRSEIVRM